MKGVALNASKSSYSIDSSVRSIVNALSADSSRFNSDEVRTPRTSSSSQDLDLALSENEEECKMQWILGFKMWLQ